MNPVVRQEDGSLLLTLPHAEGLVLCSMPQRIEALLSREGFNRRVVERLFPIAYEDSSREAEYRKLLGDDLRRSKRESMETFKRTLEDLEQLKLEMKVSSGWSSILHGQIWRLR